MCIALHVITIKCIIQQYISYVHTLIYQIQRDIIVILKVFSVIRWHRLFAFGFTTIYNRIVTILLIFTICIIIVLYSMSVQIAMHSMHDVQTALSPSLSVSLFPCFLGMRATTTKRRGGYKAESALLCSVSTITQELILTLTIPHDICVCVCAYMLWYMFTKYPHTPCQRQLSKILLGGICCYCFIKAFSYIFILAVNGETDTAADCGCIQKTLSVPFGFSNCAPRGTP